MFPNSIHIKFKSIETIQDDSNKNDKPEGNDKPDGNDKSDGKGEKENKNS